MLPNLAPQRPGAREQRIWKEATEQETVTLKASEAVLEAPAQASSRTSHCCQAPAGCHGQEPLPSCHMEVKRQQHTVCTASNRAGG